MTDEQIIALIKTARQNGLASGGTLGHHAGWCDDGADCLEKLLDTIQRQKAEIERLTLTLCGVMHFVDKWLDGEEIDKDEVTRAATMREKTLTIVEGLQAQLSAARADADYWKAETKTARIEIDDAVREARADAVRDVIRRVLGEAITIQDHRGNLGSVVTANDVERIAKEMTEGEG